MRFCTWQSSIICYRVTSRYLNYNQRDDVYEKNMFEVDSFLSDFFVTLKGSWNL